MITVVMTTYVPEDVPERSQYLAESIASLYNGLEPRSDWKLLVTDDGSPDQEPILQVLDHWQKWFGNNLQYITGPHAGIGASLNRALEVVDTHLWMYTTDDWVVGGDAGYNMYDGYDIRPAIKLIEEAGYDYVRIGHPHPGVMCEIKFQQGCGYWLHLKPAYGGYAFATRPFIATKGFYYRVGAFQEHSSSYDVETDYMYRVANSSVQLAAINLRGDEWRHIGEKEVGYKFQ